VPDGCLARTPPPDALQVAERDCARSGERTIHYLAYIHGEPELRQPGWREWVCTGLTAEEHAAGE
jgi:hypothetical protein